MRMISRSFVQHPSRLLRLEEVCSRFLCFSSTATPADTTGSTTSQQRQELVSRLKSAWEENSGHAELERLKDHVHQASSRFDDSVQQVHHRRAAVQEAQNAYDHHQKQHAALLLRREQWDASDAQAFVQSTAEEVSTRQALNEARAGLQVAEEATSRAQQDYMNVMRKRYNEEQFWTEKWRVLGTYGTWSLIGLNSAVFLVGQLMQWRRERLRLEALQTLLESKLDAISGRQVQQLEQQQQIQRQQSFRREVNLDDNKNNKSDQLALEETSEASSKDAPEESLGQKTDLRSMEYWKSLYRDVRSGERIALPFKQLDVPSAAIGATVSSLLLGTLWLLSTRRK